MKASNIVTFTGVEVPKVYEVATINDRDNITPFEGDIVVVTDTGNGKPNTYIYDTVLGWQQHRRPESNFTTDTIEFDNTGQTISDRLPNYELVGHDHPDATQVAIGEMEIATQPEVDSHAVNMALTGATLLGYSRVDEIFNEVPIASDLSINILPGNSLSVNITGPGFDPESQPLFITSVTQPKRVSDDFQPGAQASVVINPGNKSIQVLVDVTYKNTDFYVDFVLNDGTHDSNTARLTLKVQDEFSLLAQDKVVTTAYETASNIRVIEPGESGVSIFDYTQPTSGVVTDSGDDIIYTPASSFFGTVDFTYRKTDGSNLSPFGTITVTVDPPPNQSPVAIAESVTTGYNQAININVLSNDTDPDGDSVSIYDFTQPSNGVVTFDALFPSVLKYTPNNGYSGADSFTYRITDSQQVVPLSTSAIVNVTVEANSPPIASNGSITTDRRTASTNQNGSINLTSISSDPDGDSINYSITQPANGSVSLSGTTATFTPNFNFVGSTSFTYTAADGVSGSDTGTINVTVNNSGVLKGNITYRTVEEDPDRDGSRQGFRDVSINSVDGLSVHSPTTNPQPIVVTFPFTLPNTGYGISWSGPGSIYNKTTSSFYISGPNLETSLTTTPITITF